MPTIDDTLLGAILAVVQKKQLITFNELPVNDDTMTVTVVGNDACAQHTFSILELTKMRYPEDAVALKIMELSGRVDPR